MKTEMPEAMRKQPNATDAVLANVEHMKYNKNNNNKK